jgi:mono/diheme cytochrome c family protein
MGETQMLRYALVSGSLLFVAPWAGAQEVGNAARGLAYATTACGECHSVASGQERSPVRTATPFEKVANTPGMTPMALNVWLHTSHPTMPNFIIDADRIDDLVAYIATLKKKN